MTNEKVPEIREWGLVFPILGITLGWLVTTAEINNKYVASFDGELDNERINYNYQKGEDFAHLSVTKKDGCKLKYTAYPQPFPYSTKIKEVSIENCNDFRNGSINLGNETLKEETTKQFDDYLARIKDKNEQSEKNKIESEKQSLERYNQQIMNVLKGGR